MTDETVYPDPETHEPELAGESAAPGPMPDPPQEWPPVPTVEALPAETLAPERSQGEAPASARAARPRWPWTARREGLVYILLVVVLAVAAWLRFDAQNWDDYTHLHPDERFLTDVVSLLGGPLQFTDRSLAEQEAHRARCEQRYPAADSVWGAGRGGYFDAECSPLNPNNIGKGLYVYGEFPLFTVHAVGAAHSQLSRDYLALQQAFDGDGVVDYAPTRHWEEYGGAQLAGRTVSAVADWLTVLVIFLIGRRLYGPWTGLLAAALYGVAAFPVQQSHFWTVDAFTTFWVTLALYCAVRALDGAGWRQGPLPLLYTLVWFGGVMWETGAHGYPILGLLALGGLALLAYAILWTLSIRTGREWLPALAGVIASLLHLVGWGLTDLAARRDFTLTADLLAQGAASLVYAVIALAIYVAARAARARARGRVRGQGVGSIGAAVGALWALLVIGIIWGGLAQWAALFVATTATLLLVFDASELTDYALFGVALGGAVASRINVAPLALVIAVAAGLRALPALDAALHRTLRSRVIGVALSGLLTAAVISFVVFRLLQPHAFLGPGIFGLKFNPGWREDIAEAAHLTSGDWDGPPDHQWASRIPYFYPWRNIVLWGFGLPLGLVAWAGWAWAGLSIVRARRGWTRHALPFVWVLVLFGWLGGRWVTTMRYFLPIYPALALFGAWALLALLSTARHVGWAGRVASLSDNLAAPGLPHPRSALTRLVALPPFMVQGRTGIGEYLEQEADPNFTSPRLGANAPRGPLSDAERGEAARSEAGGEVNQLASEPASPASLAVPHEDRLSRPALRRLAIGGSWALLAVVLGYTALYGFAFHNIHRHQLTRVAASRWFQETVPGDFGLWVEADDGTRQLINIGRGYVAAPPAITPLAEGESIEATFTVSAAAYLTRITLNRLFDPHQTPEPETVRVRLYRNDPALGRQLLFERTLYADFGADVSPYGLAYTVEPVDQVLLAPTTDPAASYALEVTALQGAVTLVREVVDDNGPVFSNAMVEVTLVSDGMPFSFDLDFEASPLLRGHGDDIPETPTHWNVGGSDTLQVTVPIDGVIRQLDISHLGDPLRDDGEEAVRFTLTAPDGTQVSAEVRGDFNAGADPLGLPRKVIFDPPLRVRRADALGQPQTLTLTVEALDPIYTSGPVIAWEGDWDDPVPWTVCPLPGDVVYRDDLPSGLSAHDCPALNMYGGYYQGIKLWMVSEDTDDKITAMMTALDQADYLVITSNRFYDSLSRIPWRWPMTLTYYEALFDGRLGFELVRQFESPPTLGPFRIRDQVTPLDDLPDWVNEHWEAEEAFHVYDHPIVLVFRKTDTYSSEQVRALLESVTIRPVRSAMPGYVADPEPVGVVTWRAEEATKAPTMLHFDKETWEVQREGGTWRDLFDRDSLLNRSQVLAVIVWWALMVLAGWAAWPLLFVALPALPDRAYPAAKIAAWVIVAWAAWALGTLKLRAWSRLGIAVLLVALAALSVVAIWRRRAQFRRYVRANWRFLVAMEALTLALFLAFLGVRLTNPDLWHGSFGGEKPMDFAYFNAVLRSTVFPPLDPWFSGGYINYYYFGYVIVGAPVKLLGIVPSVAYNLIIPTLFAMTGVGVFSIAYNWVRARSVRPGQIEGATDWRVYNDTFEAEEAAASEEPLREVPFEEVRAPRGNAWLAGLLALALAVILGNLGTLHVFVTNVAKLDGWGQQPLYHQVRQQEIEAQRERLYEQFYAEESRKFRDRYGREPSSASDTLIVTMLTQRRVDEYIEDYANHPPLLRLWEYELGNLRRQIGAFFSGLGKVLDGQPLPMHTHRWYWGPTRIISELPNNAGKGAIAEMPYFTFLYGDLHAHMIAFPVTLLVIVWLLAEIIGAGHGLRTWWEAGLGLGLGALAVGVLRPTNSWDWITYLLLSVAGLTFVAWLGARRSRRDLSPPAFARRLWDWVRPGRARELRVVLLVVPVALAARIGFYAVQRIRAGQQVERGLRPGEMPIVPSLGLGSALLWAGVALAVVVALYILALIVAHTRPDRRLLWAWMGRVVLFVALTFVVGLPFTSYFATAYQSVKPWEDETTPLWAYLYIHGTFIFLVISFLVWQTARWLRAVRVQALEGLAVPVVVVGVGLLAVTLGGVVYGVREAAVAQLVVPLIAWATLLFFLPRQSALLRAVYALTVLALAISLGVELLVLDGDIGRQNTVFKFYLQVWFMLSIVGGVSLAWLLRSTWRWHPALRALWQGGLAVLLSVAALYPILATHARALDRFNKDETPLTLDGMEYMKYAVHGESGLVFRLDGDYDLIRWFQEHVDGTPVVMEAHLFPSEYHWGGRISIYTGLPTMLGWRFHQIQQHSLPDMNLLVQTRENNAAAFYSLGGMEGIRAALRLIDHYDIEYIVVGTLERAFYGDIQRDPATGVPTAGHAEGLAKFDTMVAMGLLTLEYSADRCLDVSIRDVALCPVEQRYADKIYRVVPGTTLGEPVVQAR